MMFCLCLFLLSACADLGTNGDNWPPLSNDDAVREAVFLYQFGNNASGQQQGAKVFFLSVKTYSSVSGAWGNGDPGTFLLLHFGDRTPPVRPFSRCTTSVNGVFDRETGERGLLFNVAEIRYVADGQAEVEGGYFEAGLSASGNTYYLERRNGKWVVVRDVMHWIS